MQLITHVKAKVVNIKQEKLFNDNVITKYAKYSFKQSWLVGSWNNSNFLYEGLGTTGGVLSSDVSVRDLSPYLREFRRKPWKMQNGKID